MAEETRAAIIAATQQLIETDGVEALSMRTLGSQIGLSRGAVYRHFKNKDELLATIATQAFATLTEQLTVPADLPSQARLHDMLTRYFTFGTAHPALYDLMFQQKWQLVDYPELQRTALQTFALLHQFAEDEQDQALVFAFIHGLVELTNAGHTEAEKGLADPAALITKFVAQQGSNH